MSTPEYAGECDNCEHIRDGLKRGIVKPLGDDWYRGTIPGNANTVMGKTAVEKGFDITSREFGALLDDMEAYIEKMGMLDDLKSWPVNKSMKGFRIAILDQWWDSLRETRLHSGTVPDAFKNHAKERFWRALLDRCRPRSGRDRTSKSEKKALRHPAGHVQPSRGTPQLPTVAHSESTVARTTYRPRPQIDEPLQKPTTVADASFAIYADDGTRTCSFLLTQAIRQELEDRLDDASFQPTLRMISFDRLVRVLCQKKKVLFRPDEQVLEAQVSESEITDDGDLHSAIAMEIVHRSRATVDIAVRSVPRGGDEEGADVPGDVAVHWDLGDNDNDGSGQPSRNALLDSELGFVDERVRSDPDETAVQTEPRDGDSPVAVAPGDEGAVGSEPRFDDEEIAANTDDAAVQTEPRDGDNLVAVAPGEGAVGSEPGFGDERVEGHARQGVWIDLTGEPQQDHALRKRALEPNPFLRSHHVGLYPPPPESVPLQLQQTDTREAKKQKVGAATPEVVTTWDSDASKDGTRGPSNLAHAKRSTRQSAKFSFADDKLVAHDKSIQELDEDDQIDADESSRTKSTRAKQKDMTEEEREAKARREEERRRRLEEAAAFGEMAQADLDAHTLSVMERNSPSEWMRAGCFWGIEDEEGMKRADPIRVHEYFDLGGCGYPGGFFPYQLHESYAMYMQELSRLNGGIFANIMGKGKTLSAWLMLFIGYHHLRLHLEIARAVLGRDNSVHNVPDMEYLDAERRCPSGRDVGRPFRCPCDPQSEFHEHEPRLAATFVSGYGQSIEAWLSEYEKLFARSKWVRSDMDLPFRVIFETNPKLDKRPSTPPATAAEKLEMQRAVDFDALEKRWNKNPEKLKRTFTAGGISRTEYPKWRVAEESRRNDERATVDRPSPTAGRFVIITKHNMINARVKYVFGKRTIRVERVITKNGSPHTEPLNVVEQSVMVYGRTIYDEFHNAKNKTTQFCQLYADMRANNQGYQWKSWALSGTPLETGLAEVMTFIDLALVCLEEARNENGKKVVGNWWKKAQDEFGNTTFVAHDKIFLELYSGKAMEQSKLWSKLADQQAQGDDVAQTGEYRKAINLAARALETFMIRRTNATKNPWGVCTSSIKGDFKTVYRPCLTDNNYTSTVDDCARQCLAVLRREGKATGQLERKTAFSRHELISYATYPGLAEFKTALLRERGSGVYDSFSNSEVAAFIMNADQPSIFADHIHLLTKGSAKFDQLVKICSLVRQSSRQDKGRPADLAARVRAKILIGTVKPIVGYITLLGLRDRFGVDAVEYLPGGLDQTSSKGRQDNWRRNDGPFILIASVGAFAESITLTEANTVVLMEPQDRTNIQDQFLFRVYRIGQTEPLTLGYILYNPYSPVEQKQLAKQKFKAKARDAITGEVGRAVPRFVDIRHPTDTPYLPNGM